MTGARTVLRTYARGVIDEHLCGYGLSMHHDMSDSDWDERKKVYYGKDRHPDVTIVDPGRNRDSLQIRIHAWRSAEWMKYLGHLNDACAAMLLAACNDKAIMPVRRYIEYREAFNAYLKKNSGSAVVKQYRHLLFVRQDVWKRCLNDSRACASASYSLLSVEKRDPTCALCRKLQYSDMVPVDVGGVRLGGGIATNGMHGLPIVFSWPSCMQCVGAKV